MLIIIFFFILSFTISTVMLYLILTLNNKSIKNLEKLSPFECGFNPFKKSRIPFSIRFFILTILFIIFDVEIALIMPLGLILNLTKILILNFVTIIIILILIVGLYHEWNQGTLEWVN